MKSKSRIITIVLIVGLAIAISANGYIYYRDLASSKEIETLKSTVNLHGDKVGYYTPPPQLYGVSMPDWTVRWWQWTASYPEDENPAVDKTANSLVEKQPNYPFYFLTAGYNEAVNRTLTIPANKGIMFPVFNGEYFLKNESEIKPSKAEELELKIFSKQETDKATFMTVQLDGKPLPYYRVTSPMFVQTLPKENLFDVKLDKDINKVYMIADGYYVFLDPLPLGKHKIYFKGKAPDYMAEASYDITIENMVNVTKKGGD